MIAPTMKTLYWFGVVGRGDHHPNGLAIQLLAPQGSKETNSEHNRIQGIPAIPVISKPSTLSVCETYSVLNPAVPYWNWTLDGFRCRSASDRMVLTGKEVMAAVEEGVDGEKGAPRTNLWWHCEGAPCLRRAHSTELQISIARPRRPRATRCDDASAATSQVPLS